MWPPYKRVEVSPGFCLLAAWFALSNSWQTLMIILLAAAVHEAGHYVILRLLGAEIASLRVGVLGGELTADRRRLSYGGDLLAVLAGPAANLLAAVLGAALGGGRQAAWIGVNLILCLFNLLPLRPLDGGQALYFLTAWLAGPEAGERAVRLAGTAAAGILAAALGALMARTGGSLWLMPMCGALALAAIREAAGQDGGRYRQ